MSTSLQRVLIMAGGTGGHVFPGLAVAQYLQKAGVEVHWLGTEQGLESRLVPAANIPLHRIAITGLRGKGIKPLLLAPFRIAAAIWQSFRIMKTIQPNVVIGMGGFVSGPGGIASWLGRYPLIIHEQNAKAGFTNRLLAPFAKRILMGFPQAFKPQSKVIMTGNPVRHDIADLPHPKARSEEQEPLHLLILGGSLGAKALNEVVPGAMAMLAQEERPAVWHQAGDKHIEATRNAYQSRGLPVHLDAFIQNMAEAYAWADVVICRAGALTVAELCAAGVGAVFVPFPYATDDHQTANARFMVDHEAALCIPQTELTERRLADIVRELTQLPDKRLAMAQAAYQLRTVGVTEKIYNLCKEVCH